MDNRVVALTALENLIHWPLPDRSGFVTSAFASGGSEDGEDGDGGGGGGAASAWVSAGDAEDVGREPRQRTLDRYRAVLLLPYLCQKLGSRWVETEVVPYLLRCVEEADPQLAVVTGMAMLGVTLPRRAPLGLAPSSTAATSASATTAGGSGANKRGAFLSVEEVQPVCALMAASSVEETRRFTAQVVLPHLHFGVALERDLTLESWDVKYVPLAVLQAETSASARRTSAVAAAAASSSDVDGDGHADAAAARARLVAAVWKHMQRQYQQLVLKARQSRAASTPSASTAGEAAASKGSPRSSGTLEGSGGTSTPPLPAPPTTDDVRRRCRALAEEDERAQFLFSGDYTALTGLWCFEEPGRLSSLVNGTRVPVAAASCGGSGSGAGVDVSGAPPHGGAVGNAFCSFRHHRRRVDNGETLRGLPPATCLPLAGADLDLYGADYASDSDVSGSAGGARGGGGGGGGGSSGDDFFSVNVRARALVADLVRWMEALTPAAPTAAASSAAAVPAKSTRLHVDGCLTLFDYLSCDERRDVLRGRWRGLVKALQGLLESPYPGPVAVATELISQLLQAIQLGLWEAEQQHLRAKLKQPVHGDKGDAAAAEEFDGCWCGIRVPASPLLTTAELQSFLFRMTRRHVAYCVAAAVSARTVPLPATPTPASMKVLTDSMGRLVRSALGTAQATLMDLLVRHHVLLRLDPSALSSAAAAVDPAGPTSGRLSMLQIGAGPGESRVASLAAWDVSFANSTVTAATPGTAAAAAVDSVTCIGLPDDATFLLNFERGTGAGTTASGSASARAWLPGTLNAASGFRLHRLVRRALLRAVPLCVDFFCLFYTSAAARAAASPVATASVPTSPLTSSVAAASGSSASGAVSLAAVCPLLLQVLVPQRALAPLLDVVCVSAQLQHNHSGGAVAVPAAVAGQPTSRTSATTRHADPAARGGSSSEAARAAGDAGEGALPAALLAALLSPPAAAVDADGSGSGAPTPAEECPASVDFGVLEAALDAVQRLMAEAAAHLAVTAPRTTQRTRAYGGGAGAADVTASPAAPPGAVLDGVCEQLFALLSACLRWVPRYTSWKARWLIAQRLPRLVASFCFFLARVNTLPATDGEGAASTTHQRRAKVWLSHTLTLLRSLWMCAAQFGVAPLNDLMDDEEIEVRCLAVGCAARCFSAATEATLRVCMTGPRGAASASRSGPAPPQTLSAELRESLSLLLDATAQCVLVAASDGDARVRCRSAEALSTLSRALSLLVVADRPAPVSGSPGQQQQQQHQGASASPCIWSRYLHSNTDALLRLMMDDRPTVQLALVSQLTDVLLMRMWGPSAGEADDGAPAAVAAAPAGAGGDGQRTADGVQYEALLQCLRQLARHELWRLRAQYAVLLAHLCGRLLLTAAQSAATAEPVEPAAAHLAGGASANSHPPALPGSSSSASSPTGAVTQRLSGGSLNADADAHGSVPAAGAAASSWAHTHPLYQLARTELLTLLVAVLFDRVRAVRDAALDAVEEMCMQLASSSSSSSGSHAGAAAAAAGLNANTFVDDVLWPRIRGYAPAWETYLSRSSLLRIAMRLRVDKTSVFIPLLDQLARDPVLNVRLVVAKITLEVLLRSSSSSPSMEAPTAAAGVHEARDGGEKASASAHADSTPAAAAAMSSSLYKPELPSGTVAYSILMDKPVPTAACGSVADGGLPPLRFDEEERTGVVLQILRQLLKDASSDVRDEAAKALKVCF